MIHSLMIFPGTLCMCKTSFCDDMAKFLPRSSTTGAETKHAACCSVKQTSDTHGRHSRRRFAQLLHAREFLRVPRMFANFGIGTLASLTPGVFYGSLEAMGCCGL